MSSNELFKNYYKDISKKINKKLEEYNSNLTKKNNMYIKENLEAFANLNSDGKLIRGILISLGYKLMGGEDIDYSLDLALAYEIFQTAILIHDDIIDNDALRRGKETVHYTNKCKYEKYDNEQAEELGKSIAICIGDYGFYEANQVILKAYGKDKNLKNILEYYNDIVLKTIEGEIVDVILPFESKYNILKTDLEENIMLIYKLKTAYYTIIGPLCLGMILKDNDPAKMQDISNIAEKIGIAFQIQDDILGIYNDMGKVIGSDIKEFKQTLLFAHTYNSDYKEELLKYYGKDDLTKENIDKVRELFKESGAYDYAYSLMNKLYNEANIEIENNIWIKQEDKEILIGFLDYLKDRQK